MIQDTAAFHAYTPFSASSVVNRSFSTLVKKPGVFLSLAFLAAFPFALLDAWLLHSMAGDREGYALIYLATRLGRSLCDLVIQGAAAYGVYRVLRMESVNLGQSLTRGLVRLPVILLACILAWAGMACGLLLLVVPGVILMIMWSVLIPACVVEKKGPMASLSRSAELTEGYRWPIFGLYVAVTLVGSIFTGVGTMLAFALPLPFAANAVIYSLIAALPSAYMAVMTATIYYDLRAAKEGISVEALTDVFS